MVHIKNYRVHFFYQQYLVLLTMAPRNNFIIQRVRGGFLTTRERCFGNPVERLQLKDVFGSIVPPSSLPEEASNARTDLEANWTHLLYRYECMCAEAL